MTSTGACDTPSFRDWAIRSRAADGHFWRMGTRSGSPVTGLCVPMCICGKWLQLRARDVCYVRDVARHWALRQGLDLAL